MDIPNRLPPPEKRKDKISKKHLRYISRLEKTRTKAEKREAFEKEVKDEERNSEHRANTVALAKTMRKITQDLAKTRSFKRTIVNSNNKKRKMTPEMQLFQDSMAVHDGDFPSPCVLAVQDEVAAATQDALTDEEIRQQFPGAIVWNELEYPHILPHADLWVFCFNCHLGMPSTQVKTFHAAPVFARGETADCFDGAPIRKWLVTHEPHWCPCKTQKI